MRFFLGLLVGTLIAIAIAAGAAHFAFGDIRNVNFSSSKDRDTSKDVAKTFELSGFDAIEAAGVFDVDVTVGGDAYGVALSGPAAELDRADIRVEGNRLILDMKDGAKRDGGWKNRHALTAKIAMPALSAFDAAGVVDASISGVNAPKMDVQLSGVGDIDIKGSCEVLEANVSGVGDLDAENLECKTVTVTVSGVGDASVYASESATASVGGVGSITVYGAPKNVTKSNSMFSSITVK
jgi:hypothetical protein